MTASQLGVPCADTVDGIALGSSRRCVSIARSLGARPTTGANSRGLAKPPQHSGAMPANGRRLAATFSQTSTPDKTFLQPVEFNDNSWLAPRNGVGAGLCSWPGGVDRCPTGKGSAPGFRLTQHESGTKNSRKMSSEFDDALGRAHKHAKRYLSRLADAPVGATCSDTELAQRFDGPLPLEGLEAGAVVDHLASSVEGGLTGVGSGRFFGWVVGGSMPAAMAAEVLAVAWDQVAAVHALSPAAAAVEDACGRWLLQLLDLPRQSGFALVTGCQMAHVTCLAAARNSILRSIDWDVERKGLFGAPPIRIVTGAQFHGTLTRALRMLGFGTDSIDAVECDGTGAIKVDALQNHLARRRQPTIVVLQAGEVNTGAFDSFGPAVEAARRHGAWVHVDGAFGLWVRASREHRKLAQGVELADSWATDGHKWLNVPYDCGYAFVADAAAHRRAFSHNAEYLVQSTSKRDAVDWTPEHSRRARCFATYAALRSLGQRGVEDLVDGCCRRARALVEGAAALPGVEAVHVPTINQGLLRFPSQRKGATLADSDRRTKQVMCAVESSGEALFTGTRWRGRFCMRVSVSSWLTNDEDIRRSLAAIERALLAND